MIRKGISRKQIAGRNCKGTRKTFSHHRRKFNQWLSNYDTENFRATHIEKGDSMNQANKKILKSGLKPLNNYHSLKSSLFYA